MPSPSMPDRTDSDQISDRELVLRLRAGHPDAMGTLYDRYAKLVYSLALQMLAQPQDAEDLTQEVFVSLWQRQQYDPDRGRLASYLVTYTRSRALDRLRVGGNRFRILQRFQRLAQPDAKLKTPFEQVAQQERMQQVRTALGQLPEAEREVLEIAYFEGYSQSQIAEKLGIPLGTVKSRSRQGLLRLRALLNTDDF